jgi:uncharacterized protein (TIRG00374 family)
VVGPGGAIGSRCGNDVLVSADTHQSKRRRVLRRWRGALALVLMVVIFGYAATQVPAALEAANQLAGVQPLYLIGGVLLEIAALVCYAMLTRALLPADGRPSLWTLFRIDLASLGASHVLPGGDATAAGLRIHWLNSLGMRRTDVVFGATLQSVGSAIVLNLMLGGALVISIPTHGGNPLYVVAAGVAAVLVALAGVVVLGLTRGQQRVVRWVCVATSRLPRVEPDAAARQVLRLAENLRTFSANRRLLAVSIGWAAANWILDAASLWVFLAAFGYHAGIEGLLIAFGLANVVAAIPITPGGLGIVEGVLIPTLVAFGAPYSVALVGVVAYRVVQFWLPIPIGGLAYVSLRAGALRHAPAPPDKPADDPPDDPADAAIPKKPTASPSEQRGGL